MPVPSFDQAQAQKEKKQDEGGSLWKNGSLNPTQIARDTQGQDPEARQKTCIAKGNPCFVPKRAAAVLQRAVQEARWMFCFLFSGLVRKKHVIRSALLCVVSFLDSHGSPSRVHDDALSCFQFAQQSTGNPHDRGDAEFTGHHG